MSANQSQLFGAGVKSVQRGTVTTATSTTVTVTSVDTSKSLLALTGLTSASATNDGRIELTNSTTITATKGASGLTTFAWQLVEFY